MIEVEFRSKILLNVYATRKGVDIIYSPNNGKTNFPIELDAFQAKEFINLICGQLKKGGHSI